MDAEFWHQRWQDNDIGFHQPAVSPLLQRHWQALSPDTDAKVWVPLCGKSQDMLWLHQHGHTLVGVELSDTALNDFSHEHSLALTWRPDATPATLHGDGFQLYCADYFSLTASQLEGVTLIYDRAALIALPADMRQQYITHLFNMLPGPWQLLLITMDYPQNERAGPPFAVSDNDVTLLFSGCQIELLSEQNILPENPGFQQQGLTSLVQRAYRIQRAG